MENYIKKVEKQLRKYMKEFNEGEICLFGMFARKEHAERYAKIRHFG